MSIQHSLIIQQEFNFKEHEWKGMECAEGHICPGLGPATDLGRPTFKALAFAASGQKAGESAALQ